ncbi:ATP-binding cassette sub-family C member 3-like [Ornithodoros turicata]|uniref:ATP-binding cassette sub-family C member 3-like n=1 Tax=Ornithodoros turicata TaxID=34597 RepID=UPI00313A3C4E
MTDVCETPFWVSVNVTGNAFPVLTPCFENTVLVWIPCVFIWLAGPIELYRLAEHYRRPLGWSAIGAAKLVLSVFLILFIQVAGAHHARYAEEYIGNVIKVITLVLVMVLQRLVVIGGQSSSAIVFTFWLLFTFSAAVGFSSFIRDVRNHMAWNAVRGWLSTVTFLVSDMQLVLSAFAEKVHVHKPPIAEAPFFSRLTFYWVNSLVWKGYRRTLTEADMPPPVSDIRPKSCCQRMSTHWKPQPGHSRATSLLLSLIRAFLPSILLIGFLETVFCIFIFIPIYLLDVLVRYVQSDDPAWMGYMYAIIMAFSHTVASLLYSQVHYQSVLLALRVKSTLVASLYRKVLSISSTAGHPTVGEVVNCLTLDTDKVFQAVLFTGEIWGAPLRLVLTLVMLWQYLGPSCLVAVGIVLLILIFSFVFAKSIQSVQAAQMSTKDLRVKYINELFNGIKILKLYAWEEPFAQRVSDVREREVAHLRKIVHFFGVVNLVWNCISCLVALVTFVTFLLVRKRSLEPSTAFVSLALFNTLRFSLLLIPDLIVAAVVCTVAIRRMTKLFLCEDVNPKLIGSHPDEGDAVTMDNASFSWHRDERVTLEDLNVHVPLGALVAVVGHVGSGKTSFLSAILGEMQCVKGSVNRRKGKIAYVPQQAWIQNASVQQNILLKRRLRPRLYDRVVEACQLQTDIQAFQAGDLTEIGVRGVNLSGGQKQRINLARAVYQNADIYIMDDPLSAVDAQVCSAIFHGVIGRRGLLRRKTRILVTHNLSLLGHMDMVIVLNEGRVREVHRGPFDPGQPPLAAFDAILAQRMVQPLRTNTGVSPSTQQKPSPEEKSYDMTVGDLSSMSMGTYKRQPAQLTRPGRKYPTAGQLIQDEAYEVGKVRSEVYRDYGHRFGYVMAMWVVVGYAVCRALDVASSVWISMWSQDAPLADGSPDQHQRNFRIIVYCLFGMAQGICIWVATVILGLRALAASKSFHDSILQRIVRAPMSFFDTIPLGRIINRFSKDIDQADYQMAVVADSLLEHTTDVIGILFLICASIPFFMLAIVPCVVIYLFIRKMYVQTSRQLQRLESVSRSPLYSCISETVNGVHSIRAYGVQQDFIQVADVLLLRYLNCYYYIMAAERWLSVRLDLLGMFIGLLTACLLVREKYTIGPGTAGLTLLYALKITDALNYLVRATADMENTLIAIERVHEFTQVETEAPWRLTPAPSPEWPVDGAMSFINYSTRYRPGLDLVLKNINLNIQPAEKVGIVGRTGSGKSSLTLAMFRIVEPAEGCVTIDGVSIATLGLHDLRSRLTVIPQEPVLFSGSLRMNLDPNGTYTDALVWEALEKAHLADFFRAKADGLDFVVQEEGHNLSLGQQQLICLARALLRNTKILVLDEATASVDPDTDVLVQETIRRDFARCTVITVAHRLPTILDADRIIVLRDGEVAECGAPADLLQDELSTFHALAVEAGIRLRNVEREPSPGDPLEDIQVDEGVSPSPPGTYP